MKEISDELYQELEYLGIIDNSGVRSHNVGKSNYHTKIISPWVVWLAYPELTEFDKDIVKRVLRTKEGDSRKMDYEKIIHVCQERIRQLDFEAKKTKNEFHTGDVLRCIKSDIIDNGDAMVELFTNGWNYIVQKDCGLVANDGAKFYPTNEFLHEHFKKI